MEQTKDQRKTRRNLWMEDALWEAAKEQARKERRSVTSLILTATERYLKEQAQPGRQGQEAQS